MNTKYLYIELYYGKVIEITAEEFNDAKVDLRKVVGSNGMVSYKSEEYILVEVK